MLESLLPISSSQSDVMSADDATRATRATSATRAAQSRIAQGLPPIVEDPDVLDRVAAIVVGTDAIVVGLREVSR